MCKQNQIKITQDDNRTTWEFSLWSGEEYKSFMLATSSTVSFLLFTPACTYASGYDQAQEGDQSHASPPTPNHNTPSVSKLHHSAAYPHQHATFHQVVEKHAPKRVQTCQTETHLRSVVSTEEPNLR